MWKYYLLVCLILDRSSAVALADEPKVIDAPPANGDVSAWVDARVAALAPSAEDKRFDEIGWSREVVAALALGKEHRRPVFAFSHDGRMNEGRC